MSSSHEEINLMFNKKPLMSQCYNLLDILFHSFLSYPTTPSDTTTVLGPSPPDPNLTHFTILTWN